MKEWEQPINNAILKDLEKKQLEMAQEWNKKYPIGVDVLVTKDDGSILDTFTQTHAYMLGASGDYKGHTAVVKIKGISEAYSLERVKAKYEGEREVVTKNESNQNAG